MFFNKKNLEYNEQCENLFKSLAEQFFNEYPNVEYIWGLDRKKDWFLTVKGSPNGGYDIFIDSWGDEMRIYPHGCELYPIKEVIGLSTEQYFELVIELVAVYLSTSSRILEVTFGNESPRYVLERHIDGKWVTDYSGGVYKTYHSEKREKILQNNLIECVDTALTNNITLF